MEHITLQLQNNITQCECHAPGWCNRHQCFKNEHFFHLCQTKKDYFKSWEEGRGPGQIPPNILEKTINFGKAVIDHVKTGMKHCTEEERLIRLEICMSNQCGYYNKDENQGVCFHKKCGCYLRDRGKFMDKLSWAESKCPVGLWGPIQQKEENM